MTQLWMVLAGLLAIGAREAFVTMRHIASVRAAERVALTARGRHTIQCTCTAGNPTALAAPRTAPGTRRREP
jgi:hypothetical protein